MEKCSREIELRTPEKRRYAARCPKAAYENWEENGGESWLQRLAPSEGLMILAAAFN